MRSVKIKYIHQENTSKYGTPSANSKLLLFSKRQKKKKKSVQNFLKVVNRVIQNSLFCSWPAQHVFDSVPHNTLLTFSLSCYWETNKQKEMPTCISCRCLPSPWAEHIANQRCHTHLLLACPAAHVSQYLCSGGRTFGGNIRHRKVETSVSAFANIQEPCSRSEHSNLDAFM